MDIREQAQQLISELGEALKLGNLSFDNQDECVVVLDERIVMVFQIDDETSSILISTVLGQLEITTPNREELLFEMLAGNYFWQLTRGATLGIERDTGLLALSYVLELPLRESVELQTVVAKLANASDYWLQRIVEISGSGESPAPANQNPFSNPGLPV